MNQIFDICIATDWEYDREFIQLIEQISTINHGFKNYLVEPRNIEETIADFQAGKINFRFLLDRGSDTSHEFRNLHNLIRNRNIPVLDDLDRLIWASDKATMHLEFINCGLSTPYTIIIPPYNNEELIYLSVSDLAKLGRSFIIKPANTTGGGIGVVDGAETLNDILKARREFENDKYLLQEKILPLIKDERKFWFRGFFCCGLIQCSWWDNTTHLYNILTPQDVEMYYLEGLYDIVKKISHIVKLNFFSTEIVVDKNGRFIIIDYVNEMCDMRLKSSHFDGVPDEIVTKIADQIVNYAKISLADFSGVFTDEIKL